MARKKTTTDWTPDDDAPRFKPPHKKLLDRLKERGLRLVVRNKNSQWWFYIASAQGFGDTLVGTYWLSSKRLAFAGSGPQYTRLDPVNAVDTVITHLFGAEQAEDAAERDKLAKEIYVEVAGKLIESWLNVTDDATLPSFEANLRRAVRRARTAATVFHQEVRTPGK